MSNVFSRFARSPQGIQTIVSQEREEPSSPPPSTSPVVASEVLRQQLEDKVNPQLKITLSEQTKEKEISIEVVQFINIIEFAHWYENNVSFFSEAQQRPLNSLIEARKIMLGGCNCDREKRKFIAEDYFRKFWIQNKNTDLLPTLLNCLKTKKVIFGDFLSFPE